MTAAWANASSLTSAALRMWARWIGAQRSGAMTRQQISKALSQYLIALQAEVRQRDHPLAERAANWILFHEGDDRRKPRGSKPVSVTLSRAARGGRGQIDREDWKRAQEEGRIQEKEE